MRLVLIVFVSVFQTFAALANQSCLVVNDFSGLNATCVSAVVHAHSTEDIVMAVREAQNRSWKISMAGARHSMAGQTINPGGMVIDMNDYNKIISLDENNKLITVQTGVTWAQIQEFLDPKKLAVDVMQDYNIFTVGGSLSVNAYGWNLNSSTLASNVQSIKILLYDGRIVRANRELNPQLFSLALGGFGLFGIILEATLTVTDNVLYQVKLHRLQPEDFPTWFSQNLAGKNGMMHNYLSLESGSLLEDMVVISYLPSNSKAEIPPLKKNILEKFVSPILGWIVNKGKDWTFQGSVWKDFVWFLEKNVLVYTIPDPISRNQIMSRSVPVVAKHQNGESLVIQVYPIPKNNFVEFRNRLREKILKHRPPIVTASISHSLKDDTAYISTAESGDRFSFVLGFVQQMTADGEIKMQAFNREMIEESIKLGGTYYLAQRLSMTQQQLRLLYPQIDEFFYLKRHYDPNETFVNMFYLKYGQLVR